MATKTKERPAEVAEIPSKAQNESRNGSAVMPDEKLKQLYTMMLKCRMLDERAIKEYNRSKMNGGNYYPAVGQEATEVGCAIDLKPEDTVAPSHRDFTAGLIKGVPVNFLFAQLFGRATSPDKGRCAPAHNGYAPLNIITPASTIAAQLCIGTGVAFANKKKKNGRVVMAFSGEGATSLGFWHEAVNLAAVHDLPIVYVIQNNLWAESVSVKLQTRLEDVGDRAKGYGIPGITVDGNDVVAVNRVAQEAIARARGGAGPTVIECKTYRWHGHSMAEDQFKYRTKEEVESWKLKDPIVFMEKYLQQKGLWSDDFKHGVEEAFNKELDEAVAFAENSPYPEGVEALDHVYSFDIRDRQLNRKSWEPKY